MQMAIDMRGSLPHGRGRPIPMRHSAAAAHPHHTCVYQAAAVWAAEDRLLRHRGRGASTGSIAGGTSAANDVNGSVNIAERPSEAWTAEEQHRGEPREETERVVLGGDCWRCASIVQNLGATEAAIARKAVKALGTNGEDRRTSIAPGHEKHQHERPKRHTSLAGGQREQQANIPPDDAARPSVDRWTCQAPDAKAGCKRDERRCCRKARDDVIAIVTPVLVRRSCAQHARAEQ
mmetsp:Transcript_48245/g.140636  ORF Transcript_48245/g.140636 Transcript_48245/m.140636 type:complete len:234 (-) Transcript_48245:676-1377(-)